MTEHFYSKLSGCFTFPDFYAFVASETWAEWHGVEVGSLNGQSAAFLGVELLNRGFVAQKLDLVELSSSQSTIAENLKPVLQLVTAIRSPMSSVEASKLYADGSLDFVMLDADHTLTSVRADIAHWYPKVRVGGILSGHDFSHYFPGVMRAALEAFPRLQVWRGSLWPDDSVEEPRRVEAEKDIAARSAHGGKDDFHAVWWVRK
jgi:hypothetical protein